MCHCTGTLKNIPSLSAEKIVFSTISGAANDENFIEMTFPFSVITGIAYQLKINREDINESILDSVI